MMKNWLFASWLKLTGRAKEVVLLGTDAEAASWSTPLSKTPFALLSR
jgi:hypothetical protein